MKEIRFTDRGTYSLGYFAADIAVLVSQDNIVFHRQVMPACLDWRSTRNLYFGENSQGRVSQFLSIFTLLNKLRILRKKKKIM